MAKYERPERTEVIEACTVDAVQCSERQIVNVNGADRVAHLGDWIVTYESGVVALFSDIVFAATFQGPLPDAEPLEEETPPEGVGYGATN